MDIRKSLSADWSKKNAVRIANWIDDDPEKIKQLMDMFFNGSFRENQRAAYPLIFISDKNPKLLSPYLNQMIEFMSDEVHDAVIRNSLRLFQNIDIPQELEGPLYEKCFNYLSAPKYPVAIRVFSMTVMANICLKYPELKVELIPLIRDILEITESPGIRSRGKKILKILGKLEESGSY